MAGVIKAKMTEKKKTLEWLSLESGIPKTTLHRKLKDEKTFTLGELERIATALKVKPRSLIDWGGIRK